VKQRIGSYEVVRVLARGGMAVVYLAHQPALDRDVALKQLDLQGASPQLAQRFVREARLAAALDHPNIVTLFDFYEDGGVPYIAMEYVSGGSLRPLVADLSLPQIFGVLEGVLAGLTHAETAGIAHRDLKPENVLISRGGTVKIADFGIARAYNALTPSLTSTGSAIGTPTYMAPEQALDEPLGPHTDIYALGVMAYEMLAGRPPFVPGRTPMAILYCHVHKAPPPLAELAPDTPEAVRDWVDRMLAKKPADRPASAAEASQALEEIAVAELGPYWRRSATIVPPEAPDDGRTTMIDAGSQPTPLSLAPVPEPRPHRHRVIGAVAVALLFLATSAAVILVSESDPPERSTPEAQAAVPGPVKPAIPYDFNGDGHPELAVGLPSSGPSQAGAVVVRGRPQSPRASNAVLTTASVGLDSVDGKEDFGTSVASADFDRDGYADLAASAPGRDLVFVIHGSKRGLHGRDSERIRPTEIRTPGRYGSRLLAADLNGDKRGDLVVGAPGAGADQVGSGAMEILLGGREQMRTGDPKTVQRSVEAWKDFGVKLRAGDVNRDGHVDLVEGAPDSPDGLSAGHLSFCEGTTSGRPKPCRAVGSTPTGTTALAVADVNNDRYDDIIQGDGIASPDEPVGGQIKVWLGGRRGPRSKPIVIAQGADGIPGSDEAGDSFGRGVDAGDLDHDKYDDIVVSAPGEDFNAGEVTVIRGGRHGVARSSHAVFGLGSGLPGVQLAGRRAGWSIAVLELSGDTRLDLAIGILGADRLEESVYVVQGSRRGAFAPDETRVWPLFQRPIDAVPSGGIKRMRLGRVDGV
jgi:serine/threonine protein kinase